MPVLKLLTSTQLSTLRTCPRKHYYRYELCLAPAHAAKPLRFGSAFHLAMERLGLGDDVDTALGHAVAVYEHCPEGFNHAAWQVERETLIQLVAGHAWRYDETWQIIAAEQRFEFPLVNPATGKPSRTYRVAGKIDGIVRLADGRLAVLEYKTVGESIEPDAPYWLRLRGDQQITIYMLAAMQFGYDVSCVVYDATRKPSIDVTNIPILDDEGNKVVLDANGERVYTKQGKPRMTGDTSLGYVLQTRPETPEEFGKRLLEDIGERPDFYYARREVPRTVDELTECQLELWQHAQQLSEMRKAGRWYRNVTRWTCSNCEFSGICLGGVSVGPGEIPSGFTILEDPHPELLGDIE